PREMLGRTSQTDDGPRVVPSPTAADAKAQSVQNSVPFSNAKASTPTTPIAIEQPQLARNVSNANRPTRLESKSPGDFTHRDSFADSDSGVGSPNMHRAMTMRRGTAWAPTSQLAGDESLNNSVDMCVREWTKKWTHAL